MLTVDYDRLRLRPGHLVLDLGCGQGRHTFEALRRGASVIALDLDRRLLVEVAGTAAAMEEAGEIDGARADRVQGDALSLPFADETFDRVIGSEVFEHIPLDRSAFREVSRVLKPEGVAAITVPRWWPERVCWVLSSEYHSNAGGHVRIYSSRELTLKLEEAGLHVQDAHHAHALHSPYWWLKCAVGVRRENAALPKLYHRFLVWDLIARPRTTRLLETALNPVLGKSLVLYAEKQPKESHLARA